MGETPVICPSCGLELFSAQQLAEHNRQMHGGPGGQPQTGAGKRAGGGMICPTCGATFATGDQLQAHERQMHGNWA